MVRVFMDRKFYPGDKVHTEFGVGEVVNVLPGDRGCPTFYEVRFVLGKKTFAADELTLVKRAIERDR